MYSSSDTFDIFFGSDVGSESNSTSSSDQSRYTASDTSLLNLTLPTSSNSTSKYCTPRSISAVESIGINNDVSAIPLTYRMNIWSTSYKSSCCDSLSSPSGLFESPLATPVSLANTSVSYDYSRSTPLTPLTPIQSNKKLMFRNYKGNAFSVPESSRFFVIKSYNVLDVCSSFHHQIWTSTDLGNKRLNKAFNDVAINDGRIFLFYSVNSSGKFCGIAEMRDKIDFTKTSGIWVEQTRWKGIFPVEWLMVKDIPNRSFQHLKVPSNEFKPVTNSRDTQEIPFDVGISMLKIFSSFKSNSTFLQQV